MFKEEVQKNALQNLDEYGWVEHWRISWHKSPRTHLIEDAAHTPNIRAPGIIFASHIRPLESGHSWCKKHTFPNLDKSLARGSMASSWFSQKSLQKDMIWKMSADLGRITTLQRHWTLRFEACQFEFVHKQLCILAPAITFKDIMHINEH